MKCIETKILGLVLLMHLLTCFTYDYGFNDNSYTAFSLGIFSIKVPPLSEKKSDSAPAIFK